MGVQARASVVPGIARASRAVEGAFESRSLEQRERDDNTVRHAGVFALYDWCWGGDDQWLYCEVDDRKVYSHDHGWYLPESGPDWSESAIMARVDEPHVPRYAVASVDTSKLAQMSGRLREPLREELVAMLSSVPVSWAVSDRELEAVGYFLERRAPAVAERLDEIGGRS